MSHPPLNLAARDFDAYAAEKATSNAYSRPRLELKQRALSWARGVVARLAELGITVDVHGSDEHPSLRNKKRVDCQWVFFWRDPAARDELDRLLERGRSIAAEIDDPSPYTRHAFLALRLDDAAVEVCFAVHPEAQVDVDNLRARLAREDGEGALTAELTAALAALPEQFVAGVSHPHTPDDHIAASAATPDALRAMIERAAEGKVPLWIGWSIPRETAIEHAAILDEQLEDAIIALAPLYKIVAWSRENDRIALDRRIESVEQERARAHAEAEAQTEKWKAEQAEARRSAAEQARARGITPEPEARRPAPRRPSLDGLFSSTPARQRPVTGDAPHAQTAPAPRRAAPPHDRPEARPEKHDRPRAQAEAPARHADPSPRASSAGGLPSEPSTPRAAHAPTAPAAPPVLDKGVKVRVLRGPFADKVGVIGELDGRGGARVLLGLLSTRLDLAELDPVVEGRERPALQTSHRKPLPAGAPAKPPTPRKDR